MITLESRPPNLEGEGEITIRNLLRNAMHMRPDRIIVGECRSGEALDMLQAMTTGHDGSLSTGHANSPRDMLRRLETMVLMTGYQMPLRAIREQIASAVDLIVHTARLKDGTRKIISMTEIYGIEDDEILTQDIFEFKQTGVREDGKIEGELGLDRPPADLHAPVRPQRRRAAARRVRHPARRTPSRSRRGPSSRAGAARRRPRAPDDSAEAVGRGRVVTAGGMVYVSSIGPIDPETGQVVPGSIKEHARQCLTNLKAQLEAAGSSLDKIAWASWSPQGRDGLRQLQRGVGALVPGRRAGRSGDADAAPPATGRVPRLARGDRGGLIRPAAPARLAPRLVPRSAGRRPQVRSPEWRSTS